MDGPDRLPPPDPKSAATMRRFDNLPIEVRRAISSAAFQSHPQASEKRLARGVSATRAAEMVKQSDHGCFKRTEGR